MSTNKLRVGSLARKLRGSDNWLDPVATLADLPTGADEGDSVMVYADAQLASNGIYLRRNGQWEFAPGGTGGDVAPYVRVLASGGVDALPAAVAALPITGGTIFLQEGIHFLESQGVLINRNNVRIMGAGPATVLRITNGNAAAFIAVGNATQVEISDLTLEVDATANPDIPVVAVTETASQVQIRNIRFTGYAQRPIQIAGSQVLVDGCTARAESVLLGYRFCDLLGTASHVTLFRNQVSQYGRFVQSQPTVAYLMLEANDWEGPAVNLESPRFCVEHGTRHVTLINNSLRTTTAGTVEDPVIDLVNTAGTTGFVLIADNRIQARYGIAVDDPSLESAVQIRRNHFQYCRQALTLTARRGISIEGNRIDAATGGNEPLISVSSDYADVANNMAISQGQALLAVAGDRSMVTGNRLINDTPTSSSDAIIVTSGSGSILVNNITNRMITDNGTDTVQANNTVMA